MFLVVFLAIRSGVHAFLFSLFLIALIEFFWNKIIYFWFSNQDDWILLLTFSGLFISVLISQLFNQKIHMTAFDGLSHILFAGFVFFLLKTCNIQYIKILTISILITLIRVLLEVRLNPLQHASWSIRNPTYFFDPNILRNQIFIPGLLSFFFIVSIRKIRLSIQF